MLNESNEVVRFVDGCNADRRFIEKHWVESAESIRELMTTTAFQESLKSLRKGVSLSDADHVAALFHARQSAAKKRRTPVN